MDHPERVASGDEREDDDHDCEEREDEGEDVLPDAAGCR